jgi:hypothetical protein
LSCFWKERLDVAVADGSVTLIWGTISAMLTCQEATWTSQSCL